MVGGVGNGNGDTSIDVGNNSGGVDGPWTVAGNDNFASSFGDDTADSEVPVASDGDSNIADSVGPNAYTFADGGNSNIAYVFDPFGTGAGSEADAGAYRNSDLAAVFGDGLTSNSATNGDFLYDILSPAGDLPVLRPRPAAASSPSCFRCSESEHQSPAGQRIYSDNTPRALCPDLRNNQALLSGTSYLTLNRC